MLFFLGTAFYRTHCREHVRKTQFVSFVGRGIRFGLRVRQKNGLRQQIEQQ